MRDYPSCPTNTKIKMVDVASVCYLMADRCFVILNGVSVETVHNIRNGGWSFRTFHDGGCRDVKCSGGFNIEAICTTVLMMPSLCRYVL